MAKKKPVKSRTHKSRPAGKPRPADKSHPVDKPRLTLIFNHFQDALRAQLLEAEKVLRTDPILITKLVLLSDSNNNSNMLLSEAEIERLKSHAIIARAGNEENFKILPPWDRMIERLIPTLFNHKHASPDIPKREL